MISCTAHYTNRHHTPQTPKKDTIHHDHTTSTHTSTHTQTHFHTKTHIQLCTHNTTSTLHITPARNPNRKVKSLNVNNISASTQMFMVKGVSRSCLLPQPGVRHVSAWRTVQQAEQRRCLRHGSAWRLVQQAQKRCCCLLLETSVCSWAVAQSRHMLELDAKWLRSLGGFGADVVAMMMI